MDPEPVNEEERPRRSSWSAALSQLPGYPREERPVVVPAASETARTVTPMKSADD
ncbi:MAG TPA: hypothetical protein VFR83_01330 [Burkholderiales bacterium]|jgi:hypothetical protein|nr:hypothetical protein [Burkholderiales bacterium]